MFTQEPYSISSPTDSRTKESLPPPKALATASLKVSLSVLLFQLFIDDIPLGEEDLVFIEDSALFASARKSKALH